MAYNKPSDTDGKRRRGRLSASANPVVLSARSGVIAPVEKRSPRKVASSSTAPVERIALTGADIARMDAICTDPPAISDDMRAAIARHRTLVRT